MSQQQPRKAGGAGWGSLLSGAVAGLESRLDNILLADDEGTRATEDAARKARLGGQKTAVPNSPKVEEIRDSARPPSRGRGTLNDRLAERLAKAAKGEKSGSARPSSEMPSGTASPLPRASKEIGSASLEGKAVGSEEATEAADRDASAEPSAPDSVRVSAEVAIASTPALVGSRPASVRPSQDSIRPSTDTIPPSEDTVVAAVPLNRSASFLEAEVTRLTTLEDENTRNYQEELHAHLERIDALQAKLEYMAKQASATARDIASSAPSGSLEKKLAEQEERNALLLEEGNKLSKTDIKQRAAIMKLRQRIQEDDKSSIELKRKLVTSEEERGDLRDRLKIVEEREKAAQTRLKGLSRLENELATARRERGDAQMMVADLRRQLREAEARADEAGKRAQTEKVEEQKRALADLNDDLANARLEKRLAEDRGKAEVKQLKEDALRQQDKAQLAELELRSEIQNLETQLELLRAHTEEVTSSTTTDTQAKLLRQVETLQTQYSLASENWQTLEGSLNARITALQKERDEIAKREADVRKKAREANTKARRYEADLESEKDKASTFETELNETKAGLAKMQTRLEQAEREMTKAKEEMEKERKTLERNLQTKLEEEKTRWRAERERMERPLPSPNPLSDYNNFLSAGSPTASWTARKASDAGLMGLYSRRGVNSSRTYSSELTPILTNDRPLSSSRRTPPIGFPPHTMLRTNTGDSSQLSREGSSSRLAGLGLNGTGSVPQSASASMAPSIDIEAIDDPMERDSYGSPHRTVNELVSHSTMAAGPSVQLVERMSAAVRRLESEKAASKEEHTRLLAQRDEAREEVVGLMREMESVKKNQESIANVEREMQELKTRYEASLEMLGEKQEEVEELKDDLEEVKKIYKGILESQTAAGSGTAKS